MPTTTTTMDMDVDPPNRPKHDANRPDASINIGHSLDYWNSVSSDVNGMLGGFPQTSRIDLLGSATFLTKLRRGPSGPSSSSSSSGKQALPPLSRVADCGAGIGRITKGFLLGVASRVDVVEPVKKFTDELVLSLEEVGANGADGQGRVGEVFNLGLQDWVPAKGRYDLIWNQWCVGHLTDAQLVEYLRRCKDGLVQAVEGEQATSAWIVVKENLSTDPKHKDVYDDEDSSVTRSDDKFRRLFKEAGLRIVATELQKGMPKVLYPVRTYALKPE